MTDGRAAAEQIQRAVIAAAAEVLAGYGAIEVPLAMLRAAAGTLAELTRANDHRVVEAAVAGEFIERLSCQLRGIDDDRIGERLRMLTTAVTETFPTVN